MNREIFCGAILPNRTYHAYVAEPGVQTFFAIGTGGVVICRLEMSAGGIYYVKLSMGFVGPGLDKVPKEEAFKELQNGYAQID